MEILSIHNDHIETEYGCVCNKCSTVFIFKKFEAIMPRCISPKPENCLIECPHCQNIMSLAQCQEFKTLDVSNSLNINMTNKAVSK